MNIWRISQFGAHGSHMGHYTYSIVSFTFGVNPIWPGHQCGMIYTLDRWTTTCRAAAHWSSNDRFGNEIWLVDFQTGGGGGGFPTFRLWYAAFVRDARGYEVWDNNGGLNYELLIGSDSQPQTLVSCSNHP